MNIGYDNSCRLNKNIYYFEYKGIRYKLMQSKSKKWKDLLITIIPGFDNQKAIKKAYITAAEFLSAFSFDNYANVTVSYLGGQGIRNSYKLRSARFLVYDFRNIPNGSDSIGYELCRIPKIENDDQRTALILWREAKSSTNKFLSFLFYWQILELGGTRTAINWVNQSFKLRNKFSRINNSEVDKITLNNKSLGNYFYEDCRNAIAHISNRRPGKTQLLLDTPEDNIRFNISSRVVGAFAHTYVSEVLGLNKFLWLKTNYIDKFPVFTDA